MSIKSLQGRRTSTWDFPDVIKFRVAMHTLWEKAIRFRHPDYDPDRAKQFISSSMSRHLSTHNISSKSMHAFLSNLAHRQTNERGRAGENIIPPPLSEVNKYCKKLKFPPLPCHRPRTTTVPVDRFRHTVSQQYQQPSPSAHQLMVLQVRVSVYVPCGTSSHHSGVVPWPTAIGWQAS